MTLKNHKKVAGPVLALALLSGCALATPTPYQPLGTPGAQGGYTTQQLDQTHFRVAFVGNSLTSRQQVENYLLYRAAELTLQQGYACFTMVNRDVDRDVRVRATPGVGMYPYWTPYWRMHGPFGWHFYDPWLDRPFFPRRYDLRTIDRYQAMADIALSRAPCQTSPATFDATQVVQHLRPYIVLPRPGRPGN